MGRLGRERTFVIPQRNAKLKIPTDLSGVAFAGYNWPRDDMSYAQAVGAASNLIRKEIRRLGLYRDKSVKQIASDLKDQADQIDAIKLMLNLVLPEFERSHLEGLARPDKTFMVDILHPNSSAIFHSELRHLVSLQLIEIREGKNLNDLFEKDGRCDLKEWLTIKPRGEWFLTVYKTIQVEQANAGS
jgi:hypothetical protein